MGKSGNLLTQIPFICDVNSSSQLNWHMAFMLTFNLGVVDYVIEKIYNLTFCFFLITLILIFRHLFEGYFSLLCVTLYVDNLHTN